MGPQAAHTASASAAAQARLPTTTHQDRPGGPSIGNETPLSAERFEIVVKGTLSPAVVVAMVGFEVSEESQGATRLVGWVPDQTRLLSVLVTLRDLNIELQSVKLIDSVATGFPAPGHGVT